MKKSINDRCPLQVECERKKCDFIRKELECPYYSANAREGYYIYDQEETRERQYQAHMDEALLASLGDDDDDDAADGGLVYIPIEQLYPHPDNPRKDLGDLTELADSIKVNGVLQNLTVVPRAEGGYTVVIGHRRLAAAKLAGLDALPCVVADLDSRSQVQTMLMENIQRSDLSVYEQAQGFQMMLDMGASVRGDFKKSGFSQTTVRRRVKMMELDQDELKEVSSRQISLSDFDRLAQIEDIKTRNKSPEGDRDLQFRWCRCQGGQRGAPVKRSRLPPKKQIKELGLKELPDSERYSGKYDSVVSINLDTWEPRERLWAEGHDRRTLQSGPLGVTCISTRSGNGRHKKRNPRPRSSGRRPSPTPTLLSRKRPPLPLSSGKSSSNPSLSRRRHSLRSCAAR